MRLLAGVAVAPAIGLPTPAEAAPALKTIPVVYQSISGWATGTYAGKAHYVYLAATYQFEADNVSKSGFTIPAGTAMVYTDEGRQVVESAWEVKE